jgi:hypothetical protein
MNQIFRLLLMGCFLGFSATLAAQELNCKITVNTPKLQQADPKVMKNLETAMGEFMNNRRWTEDVFDAQERISCQIAVNIKEELSATAFKADFQLIASRPIYGTSYSTVLFTLQDKDISFEYKEFEVLDYADGVFRSNLTSVLAFYAYMIIGMDYATFSQNGGNEYFQKAQDVQKVVPNGLEKGWESLGGQRNRYWFVENVLSPRSSDMITALYEYHRLGLDLMATNPTSARKVVLSALEKMVAFNAGYPNTMLKQVVVDGKSDEILQIFLGGDPTEKLKVYNLMVKLDAANSSKYLPLKK